MQSRVGIIVLAIAAGAALSGCLVDKKPPKEIYRSTDTLRDYSASKWIAYNVTATSLTEDIPTQTGSLYIEWRNHADLTDPATSNPIPVLQERTTFTINGESSGTVRYISQDPTTKSIRLHAIEDIDSGEDKHFWLSPSGTGGLVPTDIIPMTIFTSPLTVGSTTQVEFYAMEDCAIGAACAQSVGHFTNDIEVIGDAPSAINTNLGKFMDPIRLSFSGSESPVANVVAPLFDVRDTCGTTITTTHTGTMDVMPEIGIIRMDSTCTGYDQANNQVSIRYVFTINNTNIELP